jgi:gamma-tubulin complex component 5
MAQNVKIAALTDELIHSILKFDPQANRQAYKRAKDIATRGLRAHQYVRTNQFDVERSFTGLDEKFRVLNRDDLAVALDKRVKEINQRHCKWKPEYLQLLLLLSDQPTENSEVEALELLRPPTPPSPLTWKQILEDDPYSDEDIWNDVDFRHDSSEDEFEDKSKRKYTPRSSSDNDDTYDPEACVVSVDKGIVKDLDKAQFWRHETDDQNTKIEITELQAIRETLFMLAGLLTSLYHTNRQNHTIHVDQKYVLGHVMQKTADHLLAQFADIGRELYRLRQWVTKSSSLPLIQTFESAVRKRLVEHDKSLATLQQKYLLPETPVAVSLLALHNEVRTASGPIIRLAQMVTDIEPQLLVNPFIHLEKLFDQIGLAQTMLEKDVFDFLSHLFFECLQTYLKPIRRWMESGELGLNDETFFIFENDSGSEASSLWHDKFVLRRGQENRLRSPTFLQPAAQKIFNTGKSVVFLKQLNIYGAGLQNLVTEPRLDHETVCGNSLEMPLSPFPDLFQAAFQTWIGSKYSLASTNLREYLVTDCGLMRTLGDFKTLYLCANGSVFQDFADAIFERMDTNGHGWNDRFLLTELARGIFSTALGRTRAERIAVRSTRSKTQGRSVKRFADLSLDYAVSDPQTL